MKQESESTRGKPLKQETERPARKPLRWVGSSLEDLSQFPGRELELIEARLKAAEEDYEERSRKNR